MQLPRLTMGHLNLIHKSLFAPSFWNIRCHSPLGNHHQHRRHLHGARNQRRAKPDFRIFDQFQATTPDIGTLASAIPSAAGSMDCWDSENGVLSPFFRGELWTSRSSLGINSAPDPPGWLPFKQLSFVHFVAGR